MSCWRIAGGPYDSVLCDSCCVELWEAALYCVSLQNCKPVELYINRLGEGTTLSLHCVFMAQANRCCCSLGTVPVAYLDTERTYSDCFRPWRSPLGKGTYVACPSCLNESTQTSINYITDINLSKPGKSGSRLGRGIGYQQLLQSITPLFWPWSTFLHPDLCSIPSLPSVPLLIYQCQAT